MGGENLPREKEDSPRVSAEDKKPTVMVTSERGNLEEESPLVPMRLRDGG